MKNYLEDLEKNRKRVVAIALVLFLVAVGLFGWAYLQLNDDVLNAIGVSESVAEKVVEDATLQTVENKTDSLDEVQRSLQKLDSSFTTLKMRFDSLIEASSATSAATYELSKELVVLERGSAQRKIIDCFEPSQKSKVASILAKLQKAKLTIDKIESEKKREGRVGIFFIFMEKFEDKVADAKNILMQDTTYAILKEEEMNKFTYDPSVRYFEDNPQIKRAAEKVARKLSTTLAMDFEVRFVNLPAPEESLEVWIGKKSLAANREVFQQQIKQDIR